MKFSRNPESGLLEAYTDDGVYLGTIYTSEPMENDNTPEVDEEGEDAQA